MTKNTRAQVLAITLVLVACALLPACSASDEPRTDEEITRISIQFFDTLKMIYGDGAVNRRYEKVRHLDLPLYDNMKLLDAEYKKDVDSLFSQQEEIFQYISRNGTLLMSQEALEIIEPMLNFTQNSQQENGTQNSTGARAADKDRQARIDGLSKLLQYIEMISDDEYFKDRVAEAFDISVYHYEKMFGEYDEAKFKASVVYRNDFQSHLYNIILRFMMVQRTEYVNAKQKVMAFRDLAEDAKAEKKTKQQKDDRKQDAGAETQREQQDAESGQQKNEKRVPQNEGEKASKEESAKRQQKPKSGAKGDAEVIDL